MWFASEGVVANLDCPNFGLCCSDGCVNICLSSLSENARRREYRRRKSKNNFHYSHQIVHYKLSLILVKQFFSWNTVYWEGLLLRGLEINILLSEDWLTMDPDYC